MTPLNKLFPPLPHGKKGYRKGHKPDPKSRHFFNPPIYPTNRPAPEKPLPPKPPLAV